MKFIGLFAVSFLLIIIALSIFGTFLESPILLLALPALLMAIVLRMYVSLDERLERIEEQLGLKEESKTLTEQLEDKE